MTKPHSFDRRTIVKGGAATGLGAALGLFGDAGARAQKAAATHHHTFKFGALDVTVISDGHLNVPMRLIARDQAEDAITALVKPTLTAPGEVQYAINVVALRSGNELTLIDAGAGGNWAPTSGKLADRLEAAGIDPAKVTRVIATHCHPDHIWGLIDEIDDSPRYANADHILPSGELDFWRGVDLATLSTAAQGAGAGAKRVIRQLGDKLRSVPAGKEIVPGFAYFATPGHTPGHCSVEVASGSERLLITADTVFHPLVSFPHPDWQPPADMDGPTAVASRKRLLDKASNERLAILAYHLPFPGVGRVERKDGAYRWIA